MKKVKGSPMILIVEDEPALRRVVVKKVSGMGFAVDEAGNGTDAIRKFKDGKYVVVILDLVMPEKSGFDVLEHIRIKLKSKVPVIILSNLEQPEDIELGRNLGANDYLIKSNISLRSLTVTLAKYARA